MNFLSIASIPPLVSSVLFFLIGLFVFRANRKSTLNLLFFALCFTTFIWQFSMFLLFNAENHKFTLVLVKLAHVGIIFLPVLMYHFALKLKGAIKKIDKYFLVVSYFITFIFELLLFTNLFIDGYYEYFWSFYPKAGILHPVYLFLIVVLALRVIYILVHTLKHGENLSNALNHQIKYSLWAIIFYIFASSDFLLNYGIEFYPVGFVFILLFLSIVAYTIVKHHLMDIKVVIKYSSVIFISLLIISILAILVSLFNNPHGKYFVLINIASTIFLVIIFSYIKEYFFRIASKYLFTTLYDSKRVISDLNYRLRTTLDLKYMYEYIYYSVEAAFHSEAFAFLTFDKNKNIYMFDYKRGGFENALKIFKGSSKLHKQYTKKNKVIIVNELEDENDTSNKFVINQFRKLGIEVLVPINIKWRNIGILALGKKGTRDVYSKEDVDLLEIIGGISATSLENGSLYKNISEKNSELKKLLDVKTDFLRIANHQLNTPLSIMRMAYSSVDEKIISMKEGFSAARAGMNRMCDVISQLWTVFELEEGVLAMKKDKIDLIEMYGKMLDEKKESDQIKNKKLSINFIISDSNENFFAFANERKIHDVFSILIDNAVSYTKKGGVSVKLERIKIDNVEFVKTIVSDTGVGISEEDRKILYEKFSRGEKAGLLHPDGSGVGLYIAKRVIELSGGIFLLEKTSNEKGSVFSYTLPIFQD